MSLIKNNLSETKNHFKSDYYKAAFTLSSLLQTGTVETPVKTCWKLKTNVLTGSYSTRTLKTVANAQRCISLANQHF